MSVPVQVGLIGCGRLAEFGYLPALARAADVELRAVADPSEDRARTLATLAGVPAHPDLEALLGHTEVDAVVLATPAAAHVDDAARAVAAGIAVLVEKPPATDTTGAQRLAGLGSSVRLGFNRRFDPGVVALRECVPARDAAHLHLAITYRRASWNPYTVRDDVLLDLAPHLVDAARWLAGGEVTAVTAASATRDHARVELELSEARATIEVGAERLHAERIVVRDRGGSVVGRHRIGGPVGAVAGRLPLPRRPHRLVTSLTAQLEAFALAVRGEPAPVLATPADGVAVMAAIDAVRATAATGRRVAIPVPDHTEAAPC